jgi:magnesium-transporting ATPase (P-type)
MEDYTMEMTNTTTTVPPVGSDVATMSDANQTVPEYYIEGNASAASSGDAVNYQEYENMMDAPVNTTEMYGQAQPLPEGMDAAAMAAMAGFGMVMFAIWFGVMILMIVAMWKLFTKAGQPGWASIIPIYNLYVLLQVAGKPGWWVLLFFIPFVNIVIAFIMWHEISKAFGKEIGFTLGLFFLGVIFLPILAFGSATYKKPEEIVPAPPVAS